MSEPVTAGVPGLPGLYLAWTALTVVLAALPRLCLRPEHGHVERRQWARGGLTAHDIALRGSGRVVWRMLRRKAGISACGKAPGGYAFPEPVSCAAISVV